MTSRRRASRAALSSSASALLVTACSSSGSGEATETAADAPKIHVPLLAVRGLRALLPHAEENGYFEDAGLDVELVAKGGSSGETYQQVSTGNITAGGATWGAGLFNATKAGASLSVIASVSRIPNPVRTRRR